MNNSLEKEIKDYYCDICWVFLDVKEVFTFEGTREHQLCANCARRLEEEFLKLRANYNPLTNNML